MTLAFWCPVYGCVMGILRLDVGKIQSHSFMVEWAIEMGPSHLKILNNFNVGYVNHRVDSLIVTYIC